MKIARSESRQNRNNDDLIKNNFTKKKLLAPVGEPEEHFDHEAILSLLIQPCSTAMHIQKIEGAAALLSAQWNYAKAEACRTDPADQVAGLGRWWLERTSGEIVLSAVAAGFLGVEQEPVHDTYLDRVVPEDRALMRATMNRIAGGEHGAPCKFRVRCEEQGLQWLRLEPVASFRDNLVVTGILVNITAAQNAATRERFNFALTQYLVGTDSIDEAVVNILRLVCEELGWEWGAFWALEQRGEGELLRCQYSWHAPKLALAPFKHASAKLRLRPGQGLIGEVWTSGEARWIEDASTHPDLVRSSAARECALQSAYFFPVRFVGADGRLLRPGVLEFFSDLQRQPDAQLPELAKSISAMIALAVERMTQQERIRVRAQTDEMTGLANRSHFYDQLDQLCHRDAPGLSFGVLFIDLDQFKPINDAFGHEAGNVVLTEFARRLGGLAPPAWTIGRLGGDEFALLSPPGASLNEIGQVAKAVLEAARQRFAYCEHRLAVSASIGISTYPEHGTSTRELLHAADAAMYQSKRKGRNLVSFYDGDSYAEQARTARQLSVLSDLHCAIQRQEFFLEYQPICDSGEARVIAVEALIRWRRPNGEIVPPNLFIPIAEQSRLILDIGRWVLQQVCRDLPGLQRALVGDLRVHVNMAAPEFIDSELPQELMAIVSAAGVESRHICLELTEGVVMQHAETAVPVMRELRRLGFEIGLDDFGMGYSSLSLLKNLPIGSLKIDRLFTSGVPRDREDCAIVRAILDLGRHLKLQVIAEGVENDAQLGFLRQFGCPLVQGFLLGRPMSFERLTVLAEHVLSANPPAST
jgi:diguanylate cyclase (GGDEF)-like protein